MSLLFVAGCGWFVLWMVCGAAYTARKDGEASVRAIGQLLPAFAASTCLISFIAYPVRDPTSRGIVLWLHHAGFIGLFCFLSAVQYLQIEAWWKRRLGRSARSVAESYRRLWLLTEILPGTAAIIILLTGLRLLWEMPEAVSPAELWLMIIICVFGFFFFDGLLGFTPIVRRWQTCWQAISTGRLTATDRTPPMTLESLQLFAHFASWPCLFALGITRYNPPNPVSNQVSLIEGGLRFLPPGWPAVIVAVGMWAAAGAVVLAIRFRRLRTLCLNRPER